MRHVAWMLMTATIAAGCGERWVSHPSNEFLDAILGNSATLTREGAVDEPDGLRDSDAQIRSVPKWSMSSERTVTLLGDSPVLLVTGTGQLVAVDTRRSRVTLFRSNGEVQETVSAPRWFCLG